MAPTRWAGPDRSGRATRHGTGTTAGDALQTSGAAEATGRCGGVAAMKMLIRAAGSRCAECCKAVAVRGRKQPLADVEPDA